jgi:hypothetical protein
MKFRACFLSLLLWACVDDVEDVDAEADSTATGEDASGCLSPLSDCPNEDCTIVGRRNISALTCDGSACLGLWSGTDTWTKLHRVIDLIDYPVVGRADVWACEPDIDVDLCVQMPDVRCFRVDGAYAVEVLPLCAASSAAVDVGNGMCHVPE